MIVVMDRVGLSILIDYFFPDFAQLRIQIFYGVLDYVILHGEKA